MVCVMSALNRRWVTMFKLLRLFNVKEGRWPQPGEVFDGRNIGGWLEYQKKQFWMGDYPAECLEKLRSIGFEFDHGGTLSWDGYYALLAEFLEEYERYPEKTESYHGWSLAFWFYLQLSLVGSSDYPRERRKLLSELGVFTGGLRESAWEVTFEQFKEFCLKYARLPVQTDVTGGVQLYPWLQRTLCAKVDTPYAVLCRKRVITFLRSVSLLSKVDPGWLPWSADEDEVLRVWYPVEGVLCFDRLPERASYTCKLRVKVLGLSGKKEGTSRNLWTPEEDAVLIQWYPIEGPLVANRLSSRTGNACIIRASKLGLHRRRGA